MLAQCAAGTLLSGAKRISRLDGTPINHGSGLSLFAQYAVVGRRSAVKIRHDPGALRCVLHRHADELIRGYNFFASHAGSKAVLAHPRSCTCSRGYAATAPGGAGAYAQFTN